MNVCEGSKAKYNEEVKHPDRGTCRRKDSKKTTTLSSTQRAESKKTIQKGEGTNTPARGHTSTRSSTQHTRGAQQMCNTATLQTNKAQQPAQSMTKTTKGRGRKQAYRGPRPGPSHPSRDRRPATSRQARPTQLILQAVAMTNPKPQPPHAYKNANACM